MRKEFLPFAPPCLSEEEIAEVADTLRSDWLSSGPKTKKFEAAFAKYVGAESALALNSCTAGLHVSMILQEIGPGDEVITTPMTFCATANVVEHVGGTVVLADVEPDTLLIDPMRVAEKITAKTKMIFPVHYAGQAANMAALNALAQKHGVSVVEDAAHCMPSTIAGKMVGSGSNLAAFSFYANKNMTTGEGGMLTGPQALIDRARQISLHGMSRNAWNRFAKGGSWRYDVDLPGYKYNMSDIQSSLGLVQLSRLSDLYARRCKIVAIYEKAFAKSEYLKPLTVRPGNQSSYHLYVVQLNLARLEIDRDQFIVELTERNIGSSVHYVPIHMHSYYAKKYGWKPDDFPVASAAFQRILSLPLSSRMDEESAHDVVTAIEDICKRHSK